MSEKRSRTAGRISVALATTAFCLLVLACSQREVPAAAEVVAPAAPTTAPDSVGQDTASKQPVSRKLIRDAELHLEVDSYEAVRPALDAELAVVEGYVSTARIEHYEGGVSSAELELRVPAAKLDGFVDACSQLGTVRHESVQARDVTEEYYDALARLANARQLEARYLELVETKADSVKDLLEVERELGRVREQIETIDGRLRLLDSQIAMSKVKLQITTRDRFSGGKPATLGEQLSRTLGESAQALVQTGRMFLIVFVALLPWLAALGVGLIVLYVAGRALYSLFAMAGRALGSASSSPSRATPIDDLLAVGDEPADEDETATQRDDESAPS